MGEEVLPAPDGTLLQPPSNGDSTLVGLLTPEVARSIPYWFIAVVGLVYASGFVAVGLYLGTYGLRDVGVDLWKARYIHVGFLCSVFPMIPVLTAVLLFSTTKSNQESDPRPLVWFRFLTGIVLYLIPQLAFFIVVFFGRRFNSQDAHFLGFVPLSFILLVWLIGGVPIVLTERFFRKPPPSWRFPENLWLGVGVVLRLFVIVLTGVPFFYVLREYRDLLWELVTYHPLPFGLFILCTISIPVFPLLRKWYAGKAGFLHLRVVTLCFAIPVYYLSLISFSSSLLGYLPASRGGGDYSVAPQVVLKLNSDFSRDAVTNAFLEVDSPAASPTVSGLKKKPKTNEAPLDVKPTPSGFLTRRSVLIEETATTFFIANPSDAGGPTEWRKSQANRPTVLAIERKSILAVEYLVP
jgi:MFS family permease